jgi:hypothetical protein
MLKVVVEGKDTLLWTGRDAHGGMLSQAKISGIVGG